MNSATRVDEDIGANCIHAGDQRPDLPHSRRSAITGCNTMSVLNHRSFTIREDDLSSKATRDLIRLHLDDMYANSPPESVFALDVSGLKAPDVTVWTAWVGDQIAGIGALRDLGSNSGELKSMRTHPQFLRRGVAAALLEHIIGVARARGMRRISLETGTGLAFEAALSLYRRRGFVDGRAFAKYRPSAVNQFLHLSL